MHVTRKVLQAFWVISFVSLYSANLPVFSMEGFYLWQTHQNDNNYYLKSQAVLKPVLLKHFWLTYFLSNMHKLSLFLTVDVLKQNDKSFYQPFVSHAWVTLKNLV